MKAIDLLQKGESAIVIFTNGIYFRRKPNGTGWTGHWVINPRRNDWLDFARGSRNPIQYIR